MSYIYAIHFIEQDAVKIGKADDLKERLSDLVSIWGKIDKNKARAMKIDDIFVINYEKELHKKYENYKKPMPFGDGYTEFFNCEVWSEIDKDKFLPISNTKIIEKANNTKVKNQNNKRKKSISISLSDEEYKTLEILYQKDNNEMRNKLLSGFDLSDQNQINQIKSLLYDNTIKELEYKNERLEQELIFRTERHHYFKKQYHLMRVNCNNQTKKIKIYADKISELEDIIKYSKIDKDQIKDIDKQKIMEENAILLKEIKKLKNINLQNKNRIREVYRDLKESKRLLKRVLTQFKKDSPSKSVIKELNNKITKLIEKNILCVKTYKRKVKIGVLK